MFDDIVKALTIRISADDMTGGAFSSVGASIKSVYDDSVKINQAWELSAKIAGKLGDTVSAAFRPLLDAGAYNEMRAGLDSVATAFNRDGDTIVSALNKIGEGQASVEELTKSATKSIQMGFSDSQIQTIYGFAKAMEDSGRTAGQSFITVAEQIEDALARGRTSSLATYGLHIEKGATIKDLLGQMSEATEKLGDGALNFGDIMDGISKSWDNLSTRVFADVTDVIGESTQLDEIGQSIIDKLWEIGDYAPIIARTIAVPFVEAFNIVKDAASLLFDGMFSKGDSLRVVVGTLAKFTGDSFYGVASAVEYVFNQIFGSIQGLMQGAIGAIGKANSLLPESMQIVSQETLDEAYNTAGALADSFINGQGYWAKQREAFNTDMDRLIETTGTEVSSKKTAGTDLMKPLVDKAEQISKPTTDRPKKPVAKEPKPRNPTEKSSTARTTSAKSASSEDFLKAVLSGSDSLFGSLDEYEKAMSSGDLRVRWAAEESWRLKVDTQKKLMGFLDKMASSSGQGIKISVAGDGPIRVLLEMLLKEADARVESEGLLMPGV